MSGAASFGSVEADGSSCRDLTAIDHLSPARCPPGERDRRNRSSMWTQRSNGAAGGEGRGDTLGCPGPDGGRERLHKRRETNKSLINISVHEQKHNTEFLCRASGRQADAALQWILLDRRQGAQFPPVSATQKFRFLSVTKRYKLTANFTGLVTLTPSGGEVDQTAGADLNSVPTGISLSFPVLLERAGKV